MRNRLRPVLLTVALLTSPAIALASWRVQHASECVLVPIPDSDSGLSYGDTSGQILNQGSRHLIVECPVLNDSYQKISGVDSGTLTFKVTGYANSATSFQDYDGGFNPVRIVACRSFYSGSGQGGSVVPSLSPV